MEIKTTWIYAGEFLLVGVGFLVPFWPLSLAGLVLAAATGRWLFGVALALLLDVAWGPPLGMLHNLYFPFTIFAALCAVAYLFLLMFSCLTVFKLSIVLVISKYLVFLLTGGDEDVFFSKSVNR